MIHLTQEAEEAHETARRHISEEEQVHGPPRTMDGRSDDEHSERLIGIWRPRTSHTVLERSGPSSRPRKEQQEKGGDDRSLSLIHI